MYRKLRKSKKAAFILNMNTKIEKSDGIDWKSFKALKEQKTDEQQFDLHDLQNFYSFFNELYGHSCSRTSHEGDSYHYQRAFPDTIPKSALDNLNGPISTTEFDTAARKLLNNKSVSGDLISNEMLKNLTIPLKGLVLKLYNSCLKHGIYPWN